MQNRDKLPLNIAPVQNSGRHTSHRPNGQRRVYSSGRKKKKKKTASKCRKQ